eukprot:CAMPEP_0114130868 /NCGR_PEP_ID=MMETSP0043_2-20121206/12248_1 /TAXON_ID=464988 /ORGANISM="Hemiselmis andersenii, Strain CCMP644" /LENGTH=153 /DNA_ID=CAMNT_0001224259 /DNA_START=388 /DNA_END=849 /DNA_ORIENTATION=+
MQPEEEKVVEKHGGQDLEGEGEGRWGFLGEIPALVEEVEDEEGRQVQHQGVDYVGGRGEILGGGGRLERGFVAGERFWESVHDPEENNGDTEPKSRHYGLKGVEPHEPCLPGPAPPLRKRGIEGGMSDEACGHNSSVDRPPDPHPPLELVVLA